MNGTWSERKVAGKSVEIYQPDGARPRFGLLFLHSQTLKTLRDKPAFTSVFDRLHLGCICPHAGRSWWVDRICPEFDSKLTAEQHLLANVAPLFQSRWNLAPRSVGVFGIGMGGQGALRLAFKHPQLFPVAAGISSAFDFYEIFGEGTPLDEMYDSKEQCRQDTAILHVHPSNYPPHLFFCVDPDDDLWYRGNDRLHEKLTALGIVHTVDFTTQAGGHSWQYFDHMAERTLQFLHDGLDQESRRLL